MTSTVWFAWPETWSEGHQMLSGWLIEPENGFARRMLNSPDGGGATCRGILRFMLTTVVKVG